MLGLKPNLDNIGHVINLNKHLPTLGNFIGKHVVNNQFTIVDHKRTICEV
jgi:hypothetical protein